MAEITFLLTTVPRDGSGLSKGMKVDVPEMQKWTVLRDESGRIG